MINWKHLLLLLIVFAPGCEDLVPPKITADISTPKSAALAYLKAVQKGDAPMARALCIGTAEQKGWVDGRVIFVDGMRKFDDALYARFGRITLQIHTDMHDSLTEVADIWVTSIADGKVSADDLKAWIDPAKQGFLSHGVKPIYLTHFKQGWKVDLAQTYAYKLPADQYPAISAGYKQWSEIGEVLQGVARDVKAGKFHTVDAALQALHDRLEILQKN